ncbi:MAG: cell envelope integrity protein TolA [Ruminiclostridium sp.]|nr:cell envelope integrity protein TolA [Ruminiclostridium sp.]
MGISIYNTNNIGFSTNSKSVNTTSYIKALSEKFDYFNKTTYMHGAPVSFNVSPAFLRKAANDPEKAEYLEENLNAFPKCIDSLNAYTKTMPGSPVMTYCTYTMDENGNISSMSGCTNDPDGKIARENAERKAKEKKASEEKMKAIRAKKAEEEEMMLKRRTEKHGEIKISSSGTSVKNTTEAMITELSDLFGLNLSV